MPRVDQMFPSKWLSPSDVPSMTRVTITGVDWELLGRNEECVYRLHFKEFQKPLKLTRGRASAVAEAVGSEDSDDWIGKCVNIAPTQANIQGVRKTFVDVWTSQQPGGAGALPPHMQNARQIDEAPIKDMKPWGEAYAKRARELLDRKGLTWDGFLAWLKKHNRDALADAHGVELADVPRYVSNSFKLFTENPKQDEAVEGEVFDRETGEVNGIPNDDIPF